MKQNLEELRALARDRELVTDEILHSNAWYGHSRALKRYAGWPESSCLKAAVEHGVYFADHMWDVETKSALPVTLTRTASRCPLLRRHTGKIVFPVGSLFGYAEHLLSPAELEAERRRLGRSILIMPTHSTHHINVDFDIGHLLNQLAPVRKQYDSVQVCLYWKDINRGVADDYLKAGVEVLTAGHMYDALFLPRLKSMLDAASLVVVNEVGTQVGYAVHAGKPVLALPFDRLNFSQDPNGLSCVFQDYIKLAQGGRGDLDRYVIPFMQHQTSISPEQFCLIDGRWGITEVKSPREVRAMLSVAERVYQEPAIADQRTLEQIAYHFLNENKHDEALLLFAEARRENNGSLLTRWGQALSLRALGRGAEAEAILRELLHAVPAQPEFEHLRAQLNEMLCAR